MTIFSGAITRRGFMVSGTAFAGFATTPALAMDMPMLVVRLASGEQRDFSAEEIADMPWSELTTHTRWTNGPGVFRGPLLREVLEASGATREATISKMLSLKALNDFHVPVPARDAWDYDCMLAREMDGKMMRVRDKGPLWLVYPRDTFPELQVPEVDERWIWQLSEISVS